MLAASSSHPLTLNKSNQMGDMKKLWNNNKGLLGLGKISQHDGQSENALKLNCGVSDNSRLNILKDFRKTDSIEMEDMLGSQEKNAKNIKDMLKETFKIDGQAS